MTKTLILIRHAKSDWGSPDLDDHDRPLNERGFVSAPRIGAWLSAEGYIPDAVLCSTATRTRQTWAGIASQLENPPEPQYRRDLYLAEPAAILAAIRDSDASCLALVAHNPGIGALAWSLAHVPPRHPKFGLYPTGATLVLRYDLDHLTGVSSGAGQVIGFVVPRELPDPA